ncbi:MAG: hypothetical protein JWQ09_1618 [Segetibacter sp.]|nr:hypothetical protein [Segetibacter sp.]
MNDFTSPAPIQNNAGRTSAIQLQKIRRLILFFIIMLALSGITAFPVEMELHWLLQFKSSIPAGMQLWLTKVYDAVKETNAKYPFLLYGYDWLAFAHLVIALAFIGPYRDPVKNIGVVEWGMIACICVLPLAFIAGPIRGIPIHWQWIDCSFGIFGIIPLYICRKWIKKLEKLQQA